VAIKKYMSKQILIIEDDEFFRELIAKKLNKSGFEFSLAINGQEGVERMKTDKPALVFLDILLPDVDGFDILTKIKADKEISSIPIIILSNLGQKEDIDKGLELGATDYLIKAQIDLDEIVEKIKKYI